MIPFLLLEAWLRTGPIRYGPESIPSSIPGVAYTYVPNKDYFHPVKPIHVNKWGTLGEDFPEKKDPGEFRVIVVGDSIVLSQHYFHTGFVKTLQKKFDADSPLPGRKFRFIQAGIASHGTCQEKQLIKHFYDGFAPDLIVMGYAVNDTEGPRVPFALDINTGKLKWWAWFWHFIKNRVRTLKWIKHHASPLIVRLRGPSEVVAPKEADPTDDVNYVLNMHKPAGGFWTRWKSCVGELGEYQKEKKTPILFAIFPMLRPFHAEGLTDAYDRVEKTVRESGLTPLNLYPVFDAANADEIMHGVDPMHLNQEGHDLVAKELGRVLRSNPALLIGR